MKLTEEQLRKSMEAFVNQLGCDSVSLILAVRNNGQMHSVQISKGFNNLELLGILDALKAKSHHAADIQEVREMIKEIKEIQDRIGELDE